MIRINLLGVAPPPGAKAPSPPTTTARMAFIFAGTLVASFVVVGVFYKVWSNDVARAQHDLDREKDREKELAAVKAQNELYMKQKNQLEMRKNTITALLNGRTGPVDFMTGLAATVNTSNDLYLLNVNPSGNRMAVRGQSNTVDSIATFIAALKKKSESFDDVQLRQYYQDDQNNRLSFKFNLDFNYKPPGSPAQIPAPAAQPAGAPAAPGRRAGT